MRGVIGGVLFGDGAPDFGNVVRGPSRLRLMAVDFKLHLPDPKFVMQFGTLHSSRRNNNM